MYHLHSFSFWIGLEGLPVAGVNKRPPVLKEQIPILKELFTYFIL